LGSRSAIFDLSLVSDNQSLNANRKTPIYQSVSFRFRQQIKLARGLKVNLSQNGTSVSVGGHGLTENLAGAEFAKPLDCPAPV
jgi:Protein of unknown function (DUF4236)